MSRIAIAPRLAAAPNPACPAPQAAQPPPAASAGDLTRQLVVYWREVAQHDTATRLRRLAATCDAVRSGAASPRVLRVPALGDPAEPIVIAAVTEYVGTFPVSVERHRAVVAEATDWIRRGLALHRAAVFAALLALGDEQVNEGLAGLRLGLTQAELECVCRGATARPSRATCAFLAEWLAVLEAAERPDDAARACVAAALAALAA